MQIILYSDEVNFFKSIFKQISDNLQLPIKVIHLKNLNNLIKYLDQNCLFILDVSINGSIIFEKLFNNVNIDSKANFIIISDSDNHHESAHRIKAIRYFKKPLNQVTFTTNLKEVLNFIINCNNYVEFKEYPNCRCYLSTVYYIQVRHRYVLWYTDEKIYHVKDSFKKWESILKSKGFITTFRGIMVNKQKIVSVNKHELLLNNGKTLPVSRTYFKNFINKK